MWFRLFIIYQSLSSAGSATRLHASSSCWSFPFLFYYIFPGPARGFLPLHLNSAQFIFIHAATVTVEIASRWFTGTLQRVIGQQLPVVAKGLFLFWGPFEGPGPGSWEAPRDNLEWK